MIKRIRYTIQLVFFGTILLAQTESDTLIDNNIELPTWGTHFINAPSARILPEKTWGFKIQHRFGSVSTDSSLLNDFLGLDLPSTIRFSFAWSLSKKLYIEIGRTNYLKTIDFESKYLLTQQTKDFKMPISTALLFNASVRTSPFPSVASNAMYGADSSKFYYKPAHRLAYTSQIVFSTQFFEKLTVQISPIFVYKNLAPAFHKNMTYIISGALRYRCGLRTALLFEYANVLNNHCYCFIHPISFGVEFGTEGHTFQLFVTNSPTINPSHIYTMSSKDMTKGQFLIGFNLQRSFNRKSKNK